MQNSNIYYTTEKYANLTDEQIISQIKDGDEQALTFLLDKYKDLVNTKVGKYFIIGAEREDIVQEGMIGLYKAIKGFDNCKQNTFKTFANLCIERQLITAIKSSNSILPSILLILISLSILDSLDKYLIKVSSL